MNDLFYGDAITELGKAVDFVSSLEDRGNPRLLQISLQEHFKRAFGDDTNIFDDESARTIKGNTRVVQDGQKAHKHINDYITGIGKERTKGNFFTRSDDPHYVSEEDQYMLFGLEQQLYDKLDEVNKNYSKDKLMELFTSRLNTKTNITTDRVEPFSGKNGKILLNQLEEFLTSNILLGGEDREGNTINPSLINKFGQEVQYNPFLQDYLLSIKSYVTEALND
jgi:hypothetical protein